MGFNSGFKGLNNFRFYLMTDEAKHKRTDKTGKTILRNKNLKYAEQLFLSLIFVHNHLQSIIWFHKGHPMTRRGRHIGKAVV